MEYLEETIDNPKKRTRDLLRCRVNKIFTNEDEEDEDGVNYACEEPELPEHRWRNNKIMYVDFLEIYNDTMKPFHSSGRKNEPAKPFSCDEVIIEKQLFEYFGIKFSLPSMPLLDNEIYNKIEWMPYLRNLYIQSKEHLKNMEYNMEVFKRFHKEKNQENKLIAENFETDSEYMIKATLEVLKYTSAFVHEHREKELPIPNLLPSKQTSKDSKSSEGTQLKRRQISQFSAGKKTVKKGRPLKKKRTSRDETKTNQIFKIGNLEINPEKHPISKFIDDPEEESEQSSLNCGESEDDSMDGEEEVVELNKEDFEFVGANIKIEDNYAFETMEKGFKPGNDTGLESSAKDGLYSVKLGSTFGNSFEKQG
jgi:hypothetical protein